MKFQLLKLIIWPKSHDIPPRIVQFKPGKVNVITGVSRTGKSAIIPIIDYCLASSDCFIPIDTIRDYASWYGVVFQTEAEEILIARKVPEGTTVSDKFYLLRGLNVSIPPKIPNSNENAEGIKHILNSIASVPYYRLDGIDENKSYQSRLGFRDLMALVFQTQDLVANQNILFYKTHAHKHRERLRNWFPFILGAEDIEVLRARQRRYEVERKLNQLKREYDKSKAVSDSWIANIRGELEVAREYGLTDIRISHQATSDDLLAAVDQVLEYIPMYSQTKLNNIEEANKEILKYEVEEGQLSTEIGMLKKRLNDMKRLQSGFIEYGTSVKKRAERLHISQWLDDIASESKKCPICGSSNHPNGSAELEKISSAFKKYEYEAKNIKEIPTSFSREEDRINYELENLLNKKENYQSQLNILLSSNKKAQEEFQRSKNMYLFLGHLKTSRDTLERISDGGILLEKITSLERELSELNQIIDQAVIDSKIDAAAHIISQKIYDRLKTLDVEEKYRKSAPRFKVKDLNIKVLSNDNHWHFLAEVGSASNWVSFHIALMCALQEYFLEQNTSCVPSFVIFDQPSQVYFPKVNTTEEDEVYDPEYQNEDVIAVRDMFKTFANSILENKGAWQCIILDHADSDIYGDIKGVYEVEIWRNGKKLIPEEWYNE